MRKVIMSPTPDSNARRRRSAAPRKNSRRLESLVLWSFGDAIRPWLDHNRVAPILFTTRKTSLHAYLQFRIPTPKGDNPMTTVIERETRPVTQTGQGNGQGRCDGCPRCEEPTSGFCKIPHPKYQNRHPVCRVCGHCVLRGNHMDDASDLDDHPGFSPDGPGSVGKPSLN